MNTDKHGRSQPQQLQAEDNYSVSIRVFPWLET